MGNRPTIELVAVLAGVSRGTVDRVLNHRSYVSEEVRERVLETIRSTGYISPREAHLQQLGETFGALKLGVLLPNWEDQFYTEIERGIDLARAELGDSGVEILLRRCKTELPQEATELLEELVAQGVAGLAVCTLNDASVERKIAQLAKDGIPCITFNSDLPNSGRLCFVGQDLYKTGRVAAELLHKCVPPDGLILATVGNRKFDGHRQRLDGFCKRMEELGFPQAQILVAETFNDYQTTFSVVENALSEHRTLAGIYMANLSVSGCTEAVRSAGKKGQIHVICHDINESTRQLLLDGSVDFTIPQDMVQQGYTPLLLLRDLLRRGKTPENVENRILILCAENL